MSADRLSDPAALFAPLAGLRRVGLAVSGGPDSLALMLLYDGWRKGESEAPEAIVYSVDHGLRPEAAAEVGYVIAQAEALGLRARALRWAGDKPRTGIQAGAREARYALIAGAMAADGTEALLTAHHLEDQAETILMRLGHGSGLEGLTGMRPTVEIAGLTIIRPLLGVSRAALGDIVAGAGLHPVADPSNADAAYERVRWRRILPELAGLGLTPERLALFARRAAEADEALAGTAAQAFARLVDVLPGGGLSIERADLVRQYRGIGVRLVGMMLDRTGGAGKPHDLAPVEALHRRLVTEKPLRPVTLHGCIVTCDGERISVRREMDRRPARRHARREPMTA
jgi:tRNA(Ile)-lysidine synthase